MRNIVDICRTIWAVYWAVIAAMSILCFVTAALWLAAWSLGYPLP